MRNMMFPGRKYCGVSAGWSLILAIAIPPDKVKVSFFARLMLNYYPHAYFLKDIARQNSFSAN